MTGGRPLAPILAALLLAVPAAHAADGTRFHALHLQRDGPARGSAAAGEFTPDGPVLATLRPVARDLHGIAFDPRDGVYYGITDHDVGSLDASGRLVEVEPPASLPRLSWLGGVAFDPSERRLLIATKGGEGFFYAYGVDDRSWQVVASMQGMDVLALTRDDASGLLYAVTKPHASKRHEIVALNERGAVVSRRPVEGPRIVEPLEPVLQLATAGGAVYLLVSHDRHPRVADAIWRIDPATGAAEQAPYQRGLDLTAGTWPDWPGGPGESPPVMTRIDMGVRVIHASVSHYETPPALTRSQPSDLHVLAMRHGGLQLGDYLKKVERLRLSGTRKGVSVELVLDPEAEVQPPVVEVRVEKSPRPVVLALCAQQSVVWKIDNADGARIAAVWLFGAANAGSTVVGAEDARVRQGGPAPVATAWELEQGGVAFDEMIARIRRTTGLRESSFQGYPMAQAFTVPVPR